MSEPRRSGGAAIPPARRWVRLPADQPQIHHRPSANGGGLAALASAPVTGMPTFASPPPDSTTRSSSPAPPIPSPNAVFSPAGLAVHASALPGPDLQRGPIEIAFTTLAGAFETALHFHYKAFSLWLASHGTRG